MLSKFSVKKPYTVVVAVVLILILGFVSFDKMTVDLLPDMNLPYAVVMTTYAGASPEEVETTVTKPVEQAMATISNIKTVSSSSNFGKISSIVPSFSHLRYPSIWILPPLRCGRVWIRSVHTGRIR